jgi:hypothetical protein
MIDIKNLDIPAPYKNEINKFKEIFKLKPPTKLLSCSKFYCMENDNKNNPIKILLNNKKKILIISYCLKRLINFFLSLLKFFFIAACNLVIKKNGLNKFKLNKNILIFHREDQKIFKDRDFLSNIKFTPDTINFKNFNIFNFLEFKDCFSFLIIIKNFFFGVPNISKGYPKIMYNLYQRFYELNTSLIQIVILSRIINSNSIKRIFFTYEDLSRDKLFLYLINKKIVTYGVIHSPLLHLYRYNIYVNTSKVSLYPNFLVSKHTDKLNYIMKAKNYLSKHIKIKNQSSIPEKFINLKNLILCHPNDSIISEELEYLGRSLSKKFQKLTCINIFHPKIKKNLFTSNDFSNENSIILSSFMTNKGIEYYQLGYKVIYFGSNIINFYNPVRGYDIDFIKNEKELIKYILKLYD